MSPFYKGLHHALTSLYGDSFNLSSDNKIFEKVSAAFESVTKWLHRKKDFQPEMLMEKEPQTLINETFNVLKTPLENLSIEQDIPEELTRALEENIFHFSGFKTYHELKEASLLLKDEKGGFNSFDKFAQDVKRINERYNRNYLNAEYEFAVSSSQMAVKWKDYEKDGDRYNLQYRTAADDKVREEHAALHGITLPPSDKFWDKYYPPNGWHCRCTVVQVRKGKYDESDSDDACKTGEKATTHIDKNGSNKAAIFRFNPGKQEKIFPPKHPYYKVPVLVKENISKLERMERNRMEYERYKSDKDYNDVEFDEKTGGLKATHNGHIIHSSDKEEKFFKEELTSTQLEQECQNALFKMGHKVILRDESKKDADGNQLPSLDLQLNDKIMDIRSITTKNCGYALYNKNRQLANVKYKTGVESDSVCLYFHDGTLFSEDKLLNDIRWFKEKLYERGNRQRIEKVYVVIKDAEEILIYDI